MRVKSGQRTAADSGTLKARALKDSVLPISSAKSAVENAKRSSGLARQPGSAAWREPAWAGVSRSRDEYGGTVEEAGT